MKLVPKLIISFISALVVAVFTCSAFFAANATAVVNENIQGKTLVLIRTFESQLASSLEGRDEAGRVQSFAFAINSLVSAFPEIFEINIYSISAGKAIASNDSSMVGKAIDPEDAEAAKQDKTVVLFENDGGKRVIDVTAPLHYQGSVDYVVGIKSDIKADLARVAALILRIALIGIAFLVLVAAFAYFIARNIASPIRLAARSFRDIAEGEADLRVRLDARKNDELGNLARDFNTFIERLQGIVGEIKTAQSELESMSRALEEGSSAMAASVSRIASTVEGTRGKAVGQSEVVLGSASAIEEIAKNIEAMDGMVSDQAACVSQASAAIEQMVANISSVFQSMERMVAQFQSVSASVGEGKGARDAAASLVAGIAEHSRSLQDANATIASIASKTNLLAMNAAIEAAHAGEAGKGFSVVADEIRRLAEDAASQSRAIKQDIAEVRKAIEDVVASTDNLGKAFGKVETNIGETGRLVTEVRQAMSEQREGSNQLLGLIQNLNSITIQVRDGSTEMAKGNAAILEGTTRLKLAAEGMRADMDAVSHEVGELDRNAREAARTADSVGAAVEAMDSAVGHFKV